jgi:hypothetical protein
MYTTRYSRYILEDDGNIERARHYSTTLPQKSELKDSKEQMSLNISTLEHNAQHPSPTSHDTHPTTERHINTALERTLETTKKQPITEASLGYRNLNMHRKQTLLQSISHPKLLTTFPREFHIPNDLLIPSDHLLSNPVPSCAPSCPACGAPVHYKLVTHLHGQEPALCV